MEYLGKTFGIGGLGCKWVLEPENKYCSTRIMALNSSQRIEGTKKTQSSLGRARKTNSVIMTWEILVNRKTKTFQMDNLLMLLG